MLWKLGWDVIGKTSHTEADSPVKAFTVKNIPSAPGMEMQNIPASQQNQVK